MLSKINNFLKKALLLTLLLFFCFGVSYAQQSRELNVGQMLYQTNEDFIGDRIYWPRGWPGIQTHMMHNYGIDIGVELTWTGTDGVTRDYQIAQVLEHKFSNPEQVIVAQEFERTFRNPFPLKVIDGTDWTQPEETDDPVDLTLPSDVMIYTRSTTWTGIDIERWAYSFVNPDYDDMVILEYRFTNNSGENRNNVYFGLRSDPAAQGDHEGENWGNYYGVDYASYVGGDASADSMRLWYSWNGDERDVIADNMWSPDELWGNFEEPHYMAHVLLHADASVGDESDSPDLPVKAGWSSRSRAPDLGQHTHAENYRYLSENWDPSNPTAYARVVDANYQDDVNGFYRVMKSGLDLHDHEATTGGPVVEQQKLSLLSFGPYNMTDGDDVHIVMALVGGSVPHRLAIDAGRAYENGYTQQRNIVPLPAERDYNDMTGHHIVRNGDVYDHNDQLIAEAGEELDQPTKDAIMEIGKDIVFKQASKAIRLWDNSTTAYGVGSFNIPLAPAAPSLTVTSDFDRIHLQWGDEAATDPQAGSDIAGYRIYRNYRRQIQTSLPTDTSFVVLVDSLGPDVREYYDEKVVRGEDYYYYVTAFTSDGIESSQFQNRTGTSTVRTDQAVSPKRSPDEDWQNNIVVVPNPYHVKAATKYSGKRLNFLNLPPYAKIHIFTVAGDLVQTLDHSESGTGDEDWERQDTFSTMEIVSGVYIYVVEELNASGSSTGKQAIGRFVVIK